LRIIVFQWAHVSSCLGPSAQVVESAQERLRSIKTCHLDLRKNLHILSCIYEIFGMAADERKVHVVVLRMKRSIGIEGFEELFGIFTEAAWRYDAGLVSKALVDRQGAAWRQGLQL
jgi:hypothetical protein